ncbi:hypothetical protein AMI01nite_22960 [Aneurinibacillus migulanus]|nr:hypothetical protein AMI01nite_22960 [Aneurinibacillus migulanus]
MLILFITELLNAMRNNKDKRDEYGCKDEYVERQKNNFKPSRKGN